MKNTIRYTLLLLYVALSGLSLWFLLNELMAISKTEYRLQSISHFNFNLCLLLLCVTVIVQIIVRKKNYLTTLILLASFGLFTSFIYFAFHHFLAYEEILKLMLSGMTEDKKMDITSFSSGAQFDTENFIWHFAPGLIYWFFLIFGVLKSLKFK